MSTKKERDTLLKKLLNKEVLDVLLKDRTTGDKP